MTDQQTMAKAREILKITGHLVTMLTDEEANKILTIYYNACNRILREAGETDDLHDLPEQA